MSWEQEVFSSNVLRVAYDDILGGMLVTWAKSGRVSFYEGVDEATAQRCANAPSVGSFINSEIKPTYPHKYVG
jgi:KTSC domain